MQNKLIHLLYLFHYSSSMPFILLIACAVCRALGNVAEVKATCTSIRFSCTVSASFEHDNNAQHGSNPAMLHSAVFIMNFPPAWNYSFHMDFFLVFSYLSKILLEANSRFCQFSDEFKHAFYSYTSPTFSLSLLPSPPFPCFIPSVRQVINLPRIIFCYPRLVPVKLLGGSIILPESADKQCGPVADSLLSTAYSAREVRWWLFSCFWKYVNFVLSIKLEQYSKCRTVLLQLQDIFPMSTP